MEENKPQGGLGCNVGEIDDRDHLYAGAPSLEASPIFPIDLRSDSTVIRDQGNLGACTAFGATELFDFVRKKHKLTNWLPSPLFTYYATRQLTNQTSVDSGAPVRNALRSTIKSGVTMEKVWPYDIAKFTENPPQEVWDDAEKHQTLEYLKVDDTDKNNFVKCLNEGYPFMFGLMLYESFKFTGFLSDGKVRIPDKTKEKLLGGHCMLAVGYQVDPDGKEYMIVQNSWGSYWGNKGYCYIPMEYFLGVDSFDFWTIRLTETCDTDKEDPSPEPPAPPAPPAPPEPPAPPAPPEPKPVEPVVVPPTPTPAPVVVPEPVVPPFPENNIGILQNPKLYLLIGAILIVLLFVLMK